jgi:hypothetical protein
VEAVAAVQVSCDESDQCADQEGSLVRDQDCEDGKDGFPDQQDDRVVFHGSYPTLLGEAQGIIVRM